MSNIEITTKIGCSNACVHCPQDTLSEAYARRSNILEMSFETFRACVDKLPVDVGIFFSGFCEPWLNKDCTKMVGYAHELGHGIYVFTTLVGMTPSDIELFEPIPFKYFDVHLPSKNYDGIIVDGNYLNTLEKLSKSSIEVTYQSFGRVVPEIKSIVGGKIIYMPMWSRAGNLKKKGWLMPKRIQGVINCRFNLRNNILLPNGDVVLCCMDYGLEHVLGNLLESDYNSLFHGDEFLKVESGLKNESTDTLCRFCDLERELTFYERVLFYYLSLPKNNREKITWFKEGLHKIVKYGQRSVGKQK